MIGRVPAFQPSGPDSIPGEVRDFNSYPGIGLVSFVCVLSCVVSGDGSDILLTTDSGRLVLVHSLAFWTIDCGSCYRNLIHGLLGCMSRET